MSRHQKRLRDPLRYSLTQLEEVNWGPPDHSSSLVQDVHRLRDVPLKDLSIGDIRLLIGQSVGLRYLVPVALDSLERDPLAEGTFYRGDLLVFVTKIPPSFWDTYANLKSRAREVAMNVLDSNDAEVSDHVKTSLQRFLTLTK
ncbi:MAG TPA: contact-dependent growth inhibition system immunity protein [Pirellulaceae bacterium]|nr:contact-dependent growth inhibition system immunity protein [Pirellulaceae bacterium]